MTYERFLILVGACTSPMRHIYYGKITHYTSVSISMTYCTPTVTRFLGGARTTGGKPAVFNPGARIVTFLCELLPLTNFSFFRMPCSGE